jgi:hypothetical protein
MRNRRNPRAAAAAAIVIAMINLTSVVLSQRWEQIHAVDAVRLFAAGMLMGVALMLIQASFRKDPV